MDSDAPDFLLQFTPLRFWVFFSCHLPFCLHTLPNAVQATSEQYISYVPCGTPRLVFLQICDTLTLAITPNAMVPTVIQKIGMKLLITTEAVSLLPFSDQSHFSDSNALESQVILPTQGPFLCLQLLSAWNFYQLIGPGSSADTRLKCHPRRW